MLTAIRSIIPMGLWLESPSIKLSMFARKRISISIYTLTRRISASGCKTGTLLRSSRKRDLKGSSGFSKIETEYALIDLSFLGITNILVLRGDKAKHDSKYTPNENGYMHATELQQQINDFNNGYFIDGTSMDTGRDRPFSCGVAGYPEKHEEAPNFDMDLQYLKTKVDNGADYIVTQMFFDNAKYFNFVDRCRAIGINVPIIPGIKPITNINQLSILPKVFKVDIPTEFASRLLACTTDEDRKAAGIEWGIKQVNELYEGGAPSIHYYSLNATDSVREIVRNTLH